MSLRRSTRGASKWKTFIELTDRDSIYQVNPISHLVEGLKIKTIEGVVEKNENGEIINRDANKRKVAITVFRREIVLHARDINNQPTTTYIFKGDLTMTFVEVGVEGFATKVPVPISASYAAIKEWKDRS